jgi:hypothetical protein
MKISQAYKKLEDSVTPTQIQKLLDDNSLYKVYTSLKVSEPLLLRYITKYNLTFDKAFRTLRDLPDDVKAQILTDWKTTHLTKRELRDKYNIGPKALNRFLKIHNVEDREKVQINPEFIAYQKLVRRLTYVVIRHYKLKSTPGHEWDHKFSVYAGFHQNIHPAIIASRENLELIPAASNRSNGRECSITRDELINSVCY